MINLIKRVIAFLHEAFAKANVVVLQDMVGNTTVLDMEDDEFVCWPYGG